MTQQSTREHILLKTIDAIEKFGLQNLTTRVIADEAGVNNAALHYYFGTKEKLLEEALAQTLTHMLEDSREILSREETLESRLQALFTYLVDGVLMFPNIIRAHIQPPLMEGKPGSPFERMLDTWLEKIYTELEPGADDIHKRKLRMAVFATISTSILAGLTPFSQSLRAGVDLHSASSRDEFIRFLVNIILHQV